MSLILNIETATRHCSVGIARDGKLISIRESDEKNIHAAKVTVFAQEVCHESNIEMANFDAVAVSMGPGSYTGLRIGVSAAKGFCYALDIPLIAIPTLQTMALIAGNILEDIDLYCPMIDARRMEVYTALFDKNNKEVRRTQALIIDDASFDEELRSNTICFFGDGAEKCREVLKPKGMRYLEGVKPDAEAMAVLSHAKFAERNFENLAYFEPFYLKDFIAGVPKVKGLD